jgi:hypothetical protein
LDPLRWRIFLFPDLVANSFANRFLSLSVFWALRCAPGCTLQSVLARMIVKASCVIPQVQDFRCHPSPDVMHHHILPFIE